MYFLFSSHCLRGSFEAYSTWQLFNSENDQVRRSLPVHRAFQHWGESPLSNGNLHEVGEEEHGCDGGGPVQQRRRNKGGLSGEKIINSFCKYAVKFENLVINYFKLFLKFCSFWVKVFTTFRDLHI